MIISLVPALRAFLLADAAIASAVGNSRIFPVVLRQGVRSPSIVYNLVSEITDQHMQGASGLVFSRYQIDALAVLADDARELADLIKFRIDGFRGEMMTNESPPTVVNVQGVFSDTARTDYTSEIDLHRVSRDYFFDYGER